VWKGSIPTWVNIADRQSYTDSRTKEYDDLAFKYLSWALYPLLIGYAIYSLYFDVRAYLSLCQMLLRVLSTTTHSRSNRRTRDGTRGFCRASRVPCTRSDSS